MDSIDRGIATVLDHRADDLHKLIEGIDMDLQHIIEEIMNRGIDSMLVDLELEEGLR